MSARSVVLRYRPYSGTRRSCSQKEIEVFQHCRIQLRHRIHQWMIRVRLSVVHDFNLVLHLQHVQYRIKVWKENKSLKPSGINKAQLNPERATNSSFEKMSSYEFLEPIKQQGTSHPVYCFPQRALWTVIVPKHERSHRSPQNIGVLLCLML